MLHTAAMNGFATIMTLLLSYGADINMVDGNDQNCLDYAMQYNHDDVALAIINHKE